MSKPGKVLKGLCKKLGVRLTVKRGQKRVYKSIKVLKAQCKRKVKRKKVKKKRKVKRKRKVKKRRRKFGSGNGRYLELMKEIEKEKKEEEEKKKEKENSEEEKKRRQETMENFFTLGKKYNFKININDKYLIRINDKAGIWRYLYERYDEKGKPKIRNLKKATHYIDIDSKKIYKYRKATKRASAYIEDKPTNLLYDPDEGTDIYIQTNRLNPPKLYCEHLNLEYLQKINMKYLKRNSITPELLGELWQFIDKKITDLEHQRFLHKKIESIVISPKFLDGVKVNDRDMNKFKLEYKTETEIDKGIRDKMVSLASGDRSQINNSKKFFQFLNNMAIRDAQELGLLRETLVEYYLNIDPDDIRDVILFINNKKTYTQKLKGIYEELLYTYQEILFDEKGHPRYRDVKQIIMSDENVFLKTEKLEDYVDKYMNRLKETSKEEVLNKVSELREKYYEKQKRVRVPNETDAPVLSRQNIDTYEDIAEDRHLSHSFENLISGESLGEKHFRIINSMEGLKTDTDYMVLKDREEGAVPIEGIGIDEIRKQGTIAFRIGQKDFSFKLKRMLQNKSKFSLTKNGFYINDIEVRFKAGQHTNTFRGTISMHPKNNDSGVANTNTRYGRFHFKLEDNASNNVCYYKFSLEQGELGRMQIHELKDLEIRGSSGTVNSTFRENATKNAIRKYVNHILTIMYNIGLYRFGKKRKKKKRKNNFGKKKNKISKNMKQLCKKLGIRLTVKRGQKRVYKSIAVLKAQCLKKKRKVKKKKVVKKKKKVVKKKKKVVKKKKKVKKKSKKRK